MPFRRRHPSCQCWTVFGSCWMGWMPGSSERRSSWRAYGAPWGILLRELTEEGDAGRVILGGLRQAARIRLVPLRVGEAGEADPRTVEAVHRERADRVETHFARLHELRRIQLRMEHFKPNLANGPVGCGSGEAIWLSGFALGSTWGRAFRSFRPSGTPRPIYPHGEGRWSRVPGIAPSWHSLRESFRQKPTLHEGRVAVKSLSSRPPTPRGGSE